MRGSGGPSASASKRAPDDETVRLLLAAAEKSGWPFAQDLNAEDSQHIAFTQAAIQKGVRQRAAHAFLWPVRSRKNLTNVTKTRLRSSSSTGGGWSE